MNNLDILTEKVKKMADKLKELKDENLRLKSEVNFLQKETEINRKKLNQYYNIKKDNQTAVIAIERIIKKIDTAKVR